MRSDVGGTPVPWETAWHDALYGADGFYRRPGGPAAHFTTATHGAPGAVLATALLAYVDRLGCDRVVDVGAGRGELLRHLRAADPRLPLTGLDVVGRPDGLPADVGWTVSPGGSGLPDETFAPGSLVVAHEWLDVVPCPVAEVDTDGVLRAVLVEPATGAESLGDPVEAPDLVWCQRYWPTTEARPGDRVEVGRPRDAAWAALVDRLDGGVAIAVDYGHTTGRRPAGGSLTAYRGGVVVPTVADGSCDLTAHVAVDSLRHDELVLQREALQRVGVSGRTPDHAGARTDPAGYLAGLARAGAEATLLSPQGFGAFWWVLARG